MFQAKNRRTLLALAAVQMLGIGGELCAQENGTRAFQPTAYEECLAIELPVQEENTRALRLTAEEKCLAIHLAEKEISQQPAGGPIYLVSTRLVRGKRAGGSTGAEVWRLVQVIHYRYDGDLAILTLVDLKEKKIFKVRKEPHLAVPLAEEELRRAEDLALADPSVRKDLGSSVGSVEVEALVLQTPDEKDEFFGHRVVRLLFLHDGSYLERPLVLVDLTAQKVIIVPVLDEQHPH